MIARSSRFRSQCRGSFLRFSLRSQAASVPGYPEIPQMLRGAKTSNARADHACAHAQLGSELRRHRLRGGLGAGARARLSKRDEWRDRCCQGAKPANFHGVFQPAKRYGIVYFIPF
eukprot:scaffold7508_cov267-Pinguiococcus_pyrenoidosus.AAC.2